MPSRRRRLFQQSVMKIAGKVRLPASSRSISCLALSATLGGCSSSVHITFLDPQGPIAAAQRTHFIGVVVLVMIVVLPILLLTPFFAWRYRYRNASSVYTPKWSFSWPVEIAIWGIPFGVVIVLAVWLWKGTQALDPYSPIASSQPPLQVEVVGYDWKWLFIYPEFGIASIGQLAFPSGQPLAIDLTSDTVMQSFFIPALGSQIYAMAGMVTRLHLQANAPGSFRGENTQYNGDGFSQQKFSALAMTPADFKAWTDLVKAKGIPMTSATYDVIRQRSTVKDTRQALSANQMPTGVIYFSDIPPSLFHDVVQSFHGGPSETAVLPIAAAAKPE
jgi:cytochrome o ubiquinol oxidase subunit II